MFDITLRDITIRFEMLRPVRSGRISQPAY